MLLPFLACCWWDVGHMLTAAIAKKRLQDLNPAAYASFENLIFSINTMTDNRSHTFIESSCWADDIKAYKYNVHLWDSWHFINK